MDGDKQQEAEDIVECTGDQHHHRRREWSRVCCSSCLALRMKVLITGEEDKKNKETSLAVHLPSCTMKYEGQGRAPELILVYCICRACCRLL